jgi:hypothetical protein
MTTRYAQYIAEILNEASFITEHERDEVAQLIEEFWKDYAMNVWDFQNVASEIINRGLPLSRGASREILAEMEKNLDSDQGFNWDTLHNAINKWLKNISWSTLTDEERASFNEEACAWAVVINDKSKPMEISETIPHRLHAKLKISLLDPSLSLLEAVEFARGFSKAESSESSAFVETRKVTLFALAIDLAESIDAEEIGEYGQIVWDSRDCEYCGKKHDTPNFAYHICMPKISKSCCFCGKTVHDDQAHFPHAEDCPGEGCDCDLIAHPDCCSCDDSDIRTCK